MESLQRIVVFTQNPPAAMYRNIAAIDQALPGLSWLLVIARPRHSPGRMLRNQWRHLRRVPRLSAAVRSRLSRPSSPAPVPDAPGRNCTPASVAALENVRIHEVQSLHAPESLAAVRAFRPDLGLTLWAPILKPELFELPRLGTLNLHKGALPDYRGVVPAFWELWNGESEVGCTVHRVDAGLHTGAVVATATVPRERYSTVKGLQICLDEMGIALMRDAVVAIARGAAAPPPNPLAVIHTAYRRSRNGRRLSVVLPATSLTGPHSSGAPRGILYAAPFGPPHRRSAGAFELRR